MVAVEGAVVSQVNANESDNIIHSEHYQLNGAHGQVLKLAAIPRDSRPKCVVVQLKTRVCDVKGLNGLGLELIFKVKLSASGVG